MFSCAVPCSAGLTSHLRSQLDYYYRRYFNKLTNRPLCFFHHQGTPFRLCSSGLLPTSDKPCEPGVVAFDAEDGDISHNVRFTFFARFFSCTQMKLTPTCIFRRRFSCVLLQTAYLDVLGTTCGRRMSPLVESTLPMQPLSEQLSSCHLPCTTALGSAPPHSAPSPWSANAQSRSLTYAAMANVMTSVVLQWIL